MQLRIAKDSPGEIRPLHLGPMKFQGVPGVLSPQERANLGLGPGRCGRATNGRRWFRSRLLGRSRCRLSGRFLGSVVDSEVVDALVASRARRAVSPLRALTPRELDVLRAMAQGRTNPAIAKSLSLSESAVEKHATSIFSKLGLSEETEIHRRVGAVLALLEGDAGARPTRAPF